MTCPKCKRAIPENLSCCPHCGAVCKSANDPSSRQEETENERGCLSTLFGVGMLAVIVAVSAVLWLLFGDVKIGHKSVLFWVAVAGFLISRHFKKG